MLDLLPVEFEFDVAADAGVGLGDGVLVALLELVPPFLFSGSVQLSTSPSQRKNTIASDDVGDDFMSIPFKRRADS